MLDTYMALAEVRVHGYRGPQLKPLELKWGMIKQIICQIYYCLTKYKCFREKIEYVEFTCEISIYLSFGSNTIDVIFELRSLLSIGNFKFFPKKSIIMPPLMKPSARME